MARYKVDLDARAIQDLATIRTYIATERGPTFADRFLAKVFSHFSVFEIAPFRGQKCDEIAPGLRRVGWRKTLTIAFKVDEATETVLIVAVFYRGRDVDALLRDRTR